MLPFQALQRDLEHSHNTNAKVTNNVINHIYVQRELPGDDHDKDLFPESSALRPSLSLHNLASVTFTEVFNVNLNHCDHHHHRTSTMVLPPLPTRVTPPSPSATNTRSELFHQVLVPSLRAPPVHQVQTQIELDRC